MILDQHCRAAYSAAHRAADKASEIACVPKMATLKNASELVKLAAELTAAARALQSKLHK